MHEKLFYGDRSKYHKWIKFFKLGIVNVSSEPLNYSKIFHNSIRLALFPNLIALFQNFKIFIGDENKIKINIGNNIKYFSNESSKSKIWTL
jgi:hypothetical protein